MLADKPDFMIDLGDTTMVDKFGSFYTRSESQYKAQRYYMGRIAHSVPIFMVLGNHDGERGSDPDMSEWSLKQRHTYFRTRPMETTSTATSPLSGETRSSSASIRFGPPRSVEPPAGT
jgi:predicted phosphodiesterase